MIGASPPRSHHGRQPRGGPGAGWWRQGGNKRLGTTWWKMGKNKTCFTNTNGDSTDKNGDSTNKNGDLTKQVQCDDAKVRISHWKPWSMVVSMCVRLDLSTREQKVVIIRSTHGCGSRLGTPGRRFDSFQLFAWNFRVDPMPVSRIPKISYDHIWSSLRKVDLTWIDSEFLALCDEAPSKQTM